MCRLLRAAQDNLYRLGLLTHLQSGHVPLKVPECLRDLRAMYDAATVDDVHDAYAHFEMDDDHVFTCVGTSGPQPPAQLTAPAQLPVLSQGAQQGWVCGCRTGGSCCDPCRVGAIYCVAAGE